MHKLLPMLKAYITFKQEGISSPIASQIFNFNDEHDMNFFPDELHTSDMSSCSPNILDDVIATTSSAPIATTTTTTTTAVANCEDSEDLCCFFDDDSSFDFDPDAISTLFDSLDQSPFDTNSTYQLPSSSSGYIQIHEQQDQNLQDDELNTRLLLTDNTRTTTMSTSGQWSRDSPDSVIPLHTDIDARPGWAPWSCQQAPPPYSTVISFQEMMTCQAPPSLVGSYVGGVDILPSSCAAAAAFLDASSISRYGPMMNTRDGQMGFFHGYRPESTQRVYGSIDMQVMGDYKSLVEGCSNTNTTITPLPISEMPPLDDSTLKVSRLSAEERKEKIHRYLEKRSERNFNKKIKYACRKTLADSRPRVRGRFAKNDEHGEATARPSSSNHEYYDEEEVAVKEDMLNSSDILAHINSGFTTSFSYNYSLESWI